MLPSWRWGFIVKAIGGAWGSRQGTCLDLGWEANQCQGWGQGVRVTIQARARWPVELPLAVVTEETGQKAGGRSGQKVLESPEKACCAFSGLQGKLWAFLIGLSASLPLLIHLLHPSPGSVFALGIRRGTLPS